jgi:hypothetical protein
VYSDQTSIPVPILLITLRLHTTNSHWFSASAGALLAATFYNSPNQEERLMFEAGDFDMRYMAPEKVSNPEALNALRKQRDRVSGWLERWLHNSKARVVIVFHTDVNTENGNLHYTLPTKTFPEGLTAYWLQVRLSLIDVLSTELSLWTR